MRYIYLISITIFSVLLFYINWKLFTPPAQVSDKHDIILQLNFLEDELKHHDLGKNMQKLFPEGFVFVNALYGLSWCELAMADKQDTSLHRRAIREALYAYDQICSEQAQERFEPHLFPENGIFYSGWSNYLLSKIVLADTSFAGYSTYKMRFQQQCKDIEEAIINSESPYLESYQHHAWPADMTLAVASLQNHDRVFIPQYQAILKDWIIKIQERVDPKTHMLPHKVDAVTGKVIESPRGGSMALMLRILTEIDPVFASSQYSLFKHNFMSTALTLPCVREYPKGTSGLGDIDSGPVILGVGFPATLVSIGCLPVFGDEAESARQYIVVNAFGFEMTNRDQKKYLAGMLPMADAFIAWSRASGLQNRTEHSSSDSRFWAWQFHLLSLAFLLLLWLVYYRKPLVRLLYR